MQRHRWSFLPMHPEQFSTGLKISLGTWYLERIFSVPMVAAGTPKIQLLRAGAQTGVLAKQLV